MSASPRFVPGAAGAFRVTGRTFDPATRTATFSYAFEHGPSFTETVVFETPPTDGPRSGPGLDRALLHLHVAAGTSYYKVAAPDAVVVEDAALTAAEAEFHRRLYDDGLREFAVTNGLPVPRPVTVRPVGATAPVGPVPEAVSRPGGVLVPLGGGKDSLVLAEAVRPLAPTLFAVNPRPWVEEMARDSGLPLVVVRRRLDPGLAAVSAAGGYNGHVPITAIVSLVAVVATFLYGHDTVALAVERSASEETRTVDGVAVNHQYSKGLTFQRDLADLLATTVDPGLVVGSALRPYAELAIARAFAGLRRYHHTFCSCNTAFRQDAGPTAHWCGDCPKCRFVALMLAPFLPRGEVAAIVGRDLFDDPGQVPGFAALISDEDKPFECVGERRESAAALRLLAADPGYATTPVVAALAGPARSRVDDGDLARLLGPDPALAFPDRAVADAVDRLLAPTP